MVRDRTMFLANWVRPVFIHFRIQSSLLQPQVPFGLDTFDGDAYVSLVAFTQVRLRPAMMGRLGEWVGMPLACHEFLNLRTYVRYEDEPGIFFLAEWIPNRLAVLIGPRTYGLPYRLGRVRYRSDFTTGRLEGKACEGARRLVYQGEFDPRPEFHFAREGTLDHFLVERYAAYTHRAGVLRRFRVDHLPWPIAPAHVEVLESSLIRELPLGIPIAAHASPGVTEVSIGVPERLVGSGATLHLPQTSGIQSCTLMDCNTRTDDPGACLCPKPT